MRKTGANLEKKNKLLILEQFGDGLSDSMPRRHGPAWKSGPGCPLQAFADQQTAENTANFLSQHLGGLWSVVRCGNCKMLHVKQERKEAKPVRFGQYVLGGSGEDEKINSKIPD